MHHQVRDKLEDYLRDAALETPAEFHRHLGECQDCANELQRLEEQSQLLRSLREATSVAPRAGFYARVIERIEAQQAFSIWSVFLDRKFGFRLAVASGVLAGLLGVYLVTSEPGGPESGVAASVATASAPTDSGMQQQRDAVLVDLASYRQ